ncbi:MULTISPECIES: hypothetical protein [Halolamina]|uniref:DUF7979 domain-containing protein n=1 Tax=Halolamina pelagica TaxID=699431 RepID=A0A1I5QTT8_9EURY|nr:MULTISPECIES: hypothetical protein [Halolamina]NHX35522.1 hypothetical protein [Halolamina sp. R1-12]SFP49246.1 hypothetical protein SAMN05216277_10466 [Halolamina pelagica]
MKTHWSLLLVAVGVVLATVGGYFLWDAYVCSSTEMVSVEPADTEYEPVAFDSLSERQQDAFLRALETDGHLTVDDDLDLPYTVSYENETYRALTAHGDGCWITGIPAAPITLLGLVLVGFGARRFRAE